MPYKDRETRRRYAREWMAARRRAWFEANGPCVDCGSWNRLELDHVDRTTKISHYVWSWSAARREAELAKCQARCHSCHKTKTNRDVYPERKHGTSGMYRNARCRCPECRAWSTQSRYDWMRRKGLRVPEPRGTQSADPRSPGQVWSGASDAYREARSRLG